MWAVHYRHTRVHCRWCVQRARTRRGEVCFPSRANEWIFVPNSGRERVQLLIFEPGGMRINNVAGSGSGWGSLEIWYLPRWKTT